MSAPENQSPLAESRMASATASCSVSLQKARHDRWWAKLRSDPERWAKRMENQRKRRERDEIRLRERQQERDAWAALPKDHPRKNRGSRHTAAAKKARRQRDHVRLPDSQVANRYLHMPVAECPKELIEIKREHIRLTRMLGTNIKTV